MNREWIPKKPSFIIPKQTTKQLSLFEANRRLEIGVLGTILNFFLSKSETCRSETFSPKISFFHALYHEEYVMKVPI